MLLMLLFAQLQDPLNPEESWVHRRAERVELVDECLVRTRSSIEFSLPSTIGGEATDDLHYVPLAWFDRGTRLRALELIDETGAQVPIATPRESGGLAIAAITTYSLHLVRSEAPNFGRDKPAALHEGVARDLETIAIERDASKRKCALARFSAAARCRIDRRLDDERFQRTVIMSAQFEGSLSDFLSELTDSFLLIAVIDGRDVQRRRVLTLSWITQAVNRQGLTRWVTSRMGWSPITLRTVPRNIELTRSYHVELGSPSDDLEVMRGTLAVRRHTRITSEGLDLLIDSHQDEDDNDPAHLRFTMNVLGGHRGPVTTDAVFLLRASHAGFLRLAMLTCSLSTILLAVGLANLEALSREVEGAATLLLVIPGLLSLYVVRPGEHRLATDLFSGVRTMVITVAVAVFAAGLLLVLDLDPGYLRLGWTSLLLIAVAAWTAVLAANLPALLRALAWPRRVLERAAERRRRRQPVVGFLTPLRTPTLTLVRHAGRRIKRALTRLRRLAQALRPQSASRRHQDRRPLKAGGLYLLVWAVCVGLSVPLTGGVDRLGVERRLNAAIDDAAQDSAGHVDLWSFAEVPWTRMQAFGPLVTREKIVRLLGSDVSLSAADVPPQVAQDQTLIVMLDGPRIVEVLALPTSRDTTGPNTRPRVNLPDEMIQCRLTPADALAIVGADRDRPTASPDAARCSPD